MEKSPIAMCVASEDPDLQKKTKHLSNESEELSMYDVEEIFDSSVLELNFVNQMKESMSIILPTNDVYEKVKRRRERSGDLGAISNYNIFFPCEENDEKNEVTLTVKIPKSIHECLKKISYFSGKSMKECIIYMINNETLSLSDFLLVDRFDVDPGWYEIDMDIAANYFEITYRMR